MTEPKANKWTVVAQYPDNDELKVGNFPTRGDAQESKQSAVSDLDAEEARIFPPGEVPDANDPFGADDPPTTTPGTVPEKEAEAVDPVEVPSEPTPNRPSIDEDPVDWLPSHFIDDIQGVPVVNRKGYCVLASQYGVSVVAEPETVATPEESFAAFSATATTDDGKTYTGYGTASTERGDDEELLNELAETRAMKRAVAWATGIGMTALEELQGEP